MTKPAIIVMAGFVALARLGLTCEIFPDQVLT
jgi:hypothetical protein